MYRNLKAWLFEQLLCLTKQCSYYSYYMWRGKGAMSHREYHAARRAAHDHYRVCTWSGANYCPTCREHEERMAS